MSILVDYNRFLICGSGSAVNVYCISSDSCARSLQSHRDTVTSVVINPNNQFQVRANNIYVVCTLIAAGARCINGA